MNRNFKSFLRILWKSTLFWTFAMFCFAFFRFFGLDQENTITIREDFIEGTFPKSLIVLSALGLGLGVLYAFVDFIFEKYISKKISLGVNLLLKSLFYFIVTVLITSVVLSVASSIFGLNVEISKGWWRGDKRFWAMLFYIVLASFVFSFIKMASERFGRGIFLKMLMGRYKNPKEEERIFMFLDLKDSTTIAENLGHHLYSQFIQDCFYDLNKVVLNYEAEIYQYVGDEAVLSWPYKKGLANNNCIDLFFAFQQQCQSRKDFYLKKYRMFPQFKAGLHGGKLMAAEVGFVKKELAYHGDVINTSSRIQGECNKYNVPILLSEKILNDLKIDKLSNSKSLGKVNLKGKKEDVIIHTVTHNV